MRPFFRIFVCLFAALLAWPLCVTCARADQGCLAPAPTVMADDHLCCSDSAPPADSPAPASPERCLHCAPASANLAIDSAPPMPTLEPVACLDLPLALLDAPAVATGVLVSPRFHPPPDTLVRLHTMLTT